MKAAKIHSQFVLIVLFTSLISFFTQASIHSFDDEDCAAPTLQGSLFVEVNSPTDLTFPPGTSVVWFLMTREGEIVFRGPQFAVTLDEAGEYQGSVSGYNDCGQRSSQDFTLTVLPAITAQKLTINNGAASTTSAQVNLTLRASNASEMYITNNPDCSSDGQWEPYYHQKTWTLGEESRNSRVFAKFRTPAKTTPCLSDDILFDQTAPTVAFVNVPESRTYSPIAEFEFSATDNVSAVEKFECSFDNENFKPCPLRLTKNLNAYGMHSMRIRATDALGHVSAAAEYKWEFLNTAPIVTITRAPTTPTQETQAVFEFVGEDTGEPVTQFECQLDDGSFASCASPVTYVALASGPHIFYVRAIDNHGLSSELASYTWTIENTTPPQPPAPPTFALTRTPETITSQTDATFEWSAEAADPDTQIRAVYCQLDDATAAQPCQSPLRYSNLSVGGHQFSAYAIDSNNLRSETVTYAWQIIPVRRPIVDQFQVDSRANKLDIVVVVDNSASMWEEQKKMAARFATFIGELAGIDWQLGIITTDARDGKKSYQNGRLVPFKGTENTFAIHAQTPQMHKLFADTIRRRETGSSKEEGIRALNKMLSRPENQFFFRERAHLATIVISDEDERSNGQNLTAQNQPETLITNIRNKLGGSTSYSNHALLYMQPNRHCPQVGRFQIGHAYMRLAQLTGGIVGDICEGDYGSTLGRIGDFIKNQTYSVNLKCVPTEAIQVRYQPQPGTPVQYTLDGTKLTFTPYPPIGTNVEVTYFCD